MRLIGGRGEKLEVRGSATGVLGGVGAPGVDGSSLLALRTDMISSDERIYFTLYTFFIGHLKLLFIE